jgi:hypothetical protein
VTTLGSLLTAVERREHAFTVFRGEEPTEVEALFDRHGVEFDVQPIPAEGPDPFVLVETDGEFAGVHGVAELEWLLDPPIVPPGDRDGVSAGYRAVFDVFDLTVFTALRRRPLLAVSREIEDRAYRVGIGTLRVSFQTFSTFRSQVDVYRTLAAETGLDIHMYGVDDWGPPTIPGVTYHAVEDGASGAGGLERYWVLAFDGGGEGQSCGLVAEETADGYTGFWTSEADIVEDIVAALTST